MSSTKRTILVITGPTAGGKSNLALRLAVALDGEIVNGDSVQLYRDFDIGSAKPTAEEFRQVPHHLFSIVGPMEDMNAAKYMDLARETIESLWQRGKLPIVVGGTGLYIRALLHGLAPLPDIDPEVQETLRRFETQHRNAGLSEEEIRGELYQWLQRIDPLRAAVLHPRDISRVRRALVVKLATGESVEHHAAGHRQGDIFAAALVVIVIPEREELYANINRRVQKMLSGGLVREVQELLKRFPAEAKAFQSLGYRHVCELLRGERLEADLTEQIQRETRHFAKRQLTWWRRQVLALGWQRLSGAGKEALEEDPVKRIQDFLCGAEKGSEKEISYFVIGDETEMEERGSRKK